MMRRIAALVFIFVCASVGWILLGSTMFLRTYSTNSGDLKARVAASWGTEQTQIPPTATCQREVTSTVREKDGPRLVKSKEVTPIPLDASTIDVVLDLAHRQKGLLWYSTYSVAFSGDYTFRNSTGSDQVVTFALNFPTAKAIYDDLVFTADGKPLAISNNDVGAYANYQVPAGRSAVFRASYRSQGLDTWQYKFGAGVAQIRDFTLTMHTNFQAIDFPENTLSPTTKTATRNGWDLTWNYKDLVSGYQIGMTMPEKLQPGPLAGEISYFAPISLFFFFFLMFIITTMRGIDLHPMNYFFLAAAFFAFHILLAYLVDHISIHAAFLVCSAVSIFLVVSYLRLVVGIRFAAVEAGIAQLIYLVLFSYAFFFKGFTGLAITIGSILTLFAVMQMTGRIRWQEKFLQVLPQRT
jgi:inner membrane protein involved in colicin E2 resistance